MSKSQPAAQQGFTLIEVLAALVVLALTLGGIMNAATFYAQNGVYLQDKTISGWVANNQMVEAQLLRTWPELGKSNGRTELARQEWFWEREVEKTPDERIRRVTVRVRLNRADDDAWLTKLSAFLAQPQRSVVTAPVQPEAEGGAVFGP
jgi:general secretion pathway protein I